MLKRIISLILTTVLLASLLLTISASAAYPESKTPELSMQDILTEFQLKTLSAKSSADISAYSNLESSADQIRKDAVDALQKAGYNAYDVNEDTFDSVEMSLSTDLGKIGLSKDYNYIVVVGGEPVSPLSVVPPPDHGGSTFTYVLNGVTYTMCSFTVTSADDPYYAKVTKGVDVIKSNSQKDLERCLNAIIAYALDKITEYIPFGTIATMCGLDISDFSFSGTSTLALNCGTNWTRQFTMVWDTFYESWIYGSSVEYATLYSYMSGLYYDAKLNRFTNVQEHETIRYQYSEHYNDIEWRKEYAVLGFDLSCTQYDITGDIKYYYCYKKEQSEGQGEELIKELKVTHREDI